MPAYKPLDLSLFSFLPVLFFTCIKTLNERGATSLRSCQLIASSIFLMPSFNINSKEDFTIKNHISKIEGGLCITYVLNITSNLRNHSTIEHNCTLSKVQLFMPVILFYYSSNTKKAIFSYENII